MRLRRAQALGRTRLNHALKHRPVGGGNAAGILFNVGATALTPTGNGFVENTIAMNTCGVRGPSSENTFEEIVLVGNTADHCA
jgi:hypothetical protein